MEKMRLTLNQKYAIGLKSLNMTQADLANELGFSRNYINMLIKGSRKNELFNQWMSENVLILFKNKRSIK
jgi:DNA-binding CsgD family transcriptional regulator